MSKFFYKILILFLFSFLQVFSQNHNSVKSVIDRVVTEIYKTMTPEQLASLDDQNVMELFSDNDLKILSTKYWTFDINVSSMVYVMRDKNQKVVPFWFEPSGFQKTEMIVKNENYTYEVWSKKFESGKVELGINGFDQNRPHYFVSVSPIEKNEELILSNFYPENQYVAEMKVGAFTYHDWDELVLEDIPNDLIDGKLLTTIRGRAREAHLVGAFRTTMFSSSNKPDQIMLTWGQDPTKTQSIQWRTNTSTEDGVVKYWEKGTAEYEGLEKQAEVKVMEDRLLQNDRYINRYTTIIDNLKPSTTYSYKVGDPSQNIWSEVAEFKTAPISPAPFSFVYFGDTHRSPHWGKLINDAYKRFPESAFYSIGGDIVSTGLFRDDWDQLFQYSAEVIKNRPLMSTLGNHDDQDGLGAWMYTDLFDLPKNGPENITPEYSYSFEYSNALYLMIASTMPISEQTKWIEEQLKNSKAQWKFAMFHFPPYSYEEDYPVIRKEWGELFDKYHVDMVMSGHVHYYMRSKPMYAQKPVESPSEGTVYLISIAIPNGNRKMEDRDFVEVRFGGEYLYQKIDIDGKKLTMKTYNSEGKMRDSLEITK